MTEHERLVRRVAVAISGAPYPTHNSERKARAAIAVIAEALEHPTSAMIRDGVSYCLSTRMGDENGWSEDTKRLFTAMLDASPLKPEGDA